MNGTPLFPYTSMSLRHPLATLHYAEELYSMTDRRHIQTNYCKREFWSKKEIDDFFSGDPSQPLSYIKRVPRKVTWPVNTMFYEIASCDVNGSWDATKRLLEMLVRG